MVATRRILVVDDEPMVTRGCRRTLSEAGYEVDAVATGHEGLRRAMGGDFDLVVTDLKLPDLDGMALVRDLRQKRPEVAIVIITGFGTVPSAVEAVKLGVAAYIEKPFTPQEITDAIARALAAVQVEDKPRIQADLVRDVLRSAAGNAGFGERLRTEGSRVLSGLALSPAAKAAIVSGDIVWIEKECGELSAEERAWLESRLEAETW